jgi:hypothetical protein
MARILSTLLLLVAIPACNDSSLSLSDLPAAATDALCTYAARCGEMPDVASCKAAAGTDMGQLLADVKAGKTKYDGKAAAACLDAMRSASCNESDPLNLDEPQERILRPLVCSGCVSGWPSKTTTGGPQPRWFQTDTR